MSAFSREKTGHAKMFDWWSWWLKNLWSSRLETTSIFGSMACT